MHSRDLRGSGWSRTTSFRTTTGLQPGTLPFGHTPESWGPRAPALRLPSRVPRRCRKTLKYEKPAGGFPRAGFPFPGCLVNQLGYEALPRIGLLAHTFGRKAGAAIADGLMPIVIGAIDRGAYLS